MRNMSFYTVLLQCALVFSVLKFTTANLTVENLYSMLAGKIHVINDEMSMLRQILMSTKSELTSTKADLISTQAKLKSTQAEVENIKLQCGLSTRTTTDPVSSVRRTKNSTTTSPEEKTTTSPEEKTTTSPEEKTTTSPEEKTTTSPEEKTTTSPEEKTCCQVVKTAIMRMKVVQRRTKQDLENLIENKVGSLNEDIASNTKGIRSLESDINELAVDFVGLKNNSDRNLVKTEQGVKVLTEKMTSYNMAMKKDMTIFNVDVSVLTKNLNNLTQQVRNEMKGELEQLSNDFHVLSNNHTILAETVKDQTSTITKMIKTEIDKAEHCQSGTVTLWKRYSHSIPSTVTIVFKKPFKNKPAFTVGASAFDFDSNTNLRLTLDIHELSSTQAKVYVNVWHKTIVYGAGFNWMACPT
ncbi:probable transcription-associated protein 1 isoform X1 [Ruditapes philippinarum]|uniref:probable transcription-associated protein 1 isoform X1 n=1 Tax=Ruditapes philippinarum TaxID=129788 RepID=UPI00295BAB9C|nr:probable transcription-associated protein 1 isoform X1 [Ruditapes philippinarum]